MSGFPPNGGFPGGYPVTPAPGIPPGGPPAGQFLAALQAVTTALHNQTAAIRSGGGVTVGGPTFQIGEIAAPAPPASGAILYVDSTTHNLMVVLANGTRTTLA